MPLEKPIRYLVNHIQSELNDNGWKLKFFKKNCFRNDCHGYFDENSKTIAVEKIKSWPSILAHEFSHYLQFKNKHKTFYAYYGLGYNPDEIITDYLKNKIKYSKKVSTSFNVVRNNELYCDIIAYKLLRKFKIKIDKSLYTKHTNLHMIYYHYLEKTKNKNIDFNLFYNKKAIDIVPDIFKKSYVFSIPSDMYNNVIGTLIL